MEDNLKIIDIRVYDDLTELLIKEFSMSTDREDRAIILDSLLETLSEMEATEIKVLETRVGNIYCKTVYVPKGTLLVGEKYRVEQINNCLLGGFYIFDEVKGLYTVRQGETFKSPRFTRRGAYALENSVFQSIYEVPSTYKRETLNEYINEHIYYKGK
jgi:hypothetical protein